MGNTTCSLAGSILRMALRRRETHTRWVTGPKRLLEHPAMGGWVFLIQAAASTCDAPDITHLICHCCSTCRPSRVTSDVRCRQRLVDASAQLWVRRQQDPVRQRIWRPGARFAGDRRQYGRAVDARAACNGSSAACGAVFETAARRWRQCSQACCGIYGVCRWQALATTSVCSAPLIRHKCGCLIANAIEALEL